MPSTVTSVGESAFCGCTALQTVTLNNTGTIDNSAFKNCTALTRVNIGEGLTGFKYSSYDFYTPFYGCSNLATVNVTDLKKFCALSCLSYLTDSSYGTPESKTLMVKGTIHSSTSELVIPEGMTSISQYAFRYFSNVTKIKLPSTMKEITSSNFYNHTYLKEITLPSTVTSVGESAFNGCTNLEFVICRATKCPSVTSSIATNPGDISLKVPRGKASLYKAANIWKEFKISESIYDVEDKNIFYFGSLTSNGYVIANLNSDYKVKSWSSTNTNIAVVASTTNYAARICAKDYVYDGTTAIPYKEFSIIADLGGCDTCIWNIKLYPREVALKDGNAYKNTIKFPNEKISYTRTYKSTVVGKWQAFYVPFDIEITDELLQDYDFAKLYMVSYQDANNNDVIDATDPLKMIFNKLSVGKTLRANMPYYVRVKSAGTKTITVNNTELKAVANGSVNCSTTEHEYSLVGVYDKTNLNGLYAMATSGNFSHYTKDIYLGSFRWYMEIKSRTGSGAEFENYAHPIEIFVDGEDETTGIIALEDKASASQNDKIFTLDGRQVTDYDNLPSGIYIINGKKVYKK